MAAGMGGGVGWGGDGVPVADGIWISLGRPELGWGGIGWIGWHRLGWDGRAVPLLHFLAACWESIFLPYSISYIPKSRPLATQTRAETTQQMNRQHATYVPHATGSTCGKTDAHRK